MYSGPWGIDPKTLNVEVAASGERAKQRFMTSRTVNNQANDIERQGAARSKAILADPSGQDWIKAQESEAAIAAARFNAQNVRDQANSAAQTPLTPDEKRARDLGTSTYDGSQKTGFSRDN